MYLIDFSNVVTNYFFFMLKAFHKLLLFYVESFPSINIAHLRKQRCDEQNYWIAMQMANYFFPSVLIDTSGTNAEIADE